MSNIFWKSKITKCTLSMQASGHAPPSVCNHIFVVPKQALRYVCGPQNINITKLPSRCGAHAFVDPSQVMSNSRMVNIVLSGPIDCQIRALGELAYCLMNFDASMRSKTFRPGPRPGPYKRSSHPKGNTNDHSSISFVPKQTISSDDDGEIVSEHPDPY